MLQQQLEKALAADRRLRNRLEFAYALTSLLIQSGEMTDENIITLRLIGREIKTCKMIINSYRFAHHVRD
jgi:hypothetical protein